MNNNKMTGGYSLLEVLVAIVILAIFSIGGYVGINKSIELNAQTQAMLDAQLRVSNAAEQLMDAGIKASDVSGISDAYPDVEIELQAGVGDIYTTPFYKATISSEYHEDKPPVSISTNIKRVN